MRKLRKPGRRRLAGMIPSPARERDLADIQIAAGVDRDAVRRPERIHGRTEIRVVDPAEQRAVMRQNAEAGTDVRRVLVDGHAGTKFADITHRALAAGHAQSARPMQVVPLRLVAAGAVEHLDPVVLAIGDIDPAVVVAGDVVNDVEFTGPGAASRPRT